MSRIARWTLALIVALLAVGACFGSALAEPRPPAGPPPDNAALERAYTFERDRLKLQGERLKGADEYADAVARLIARLKEQHQETAPLERALAAFRARLAAPRHEWELARDILAAHAGFNDQGKVTDADKARVTLREAHNHMERVAEICRVAFRDLRAALEAYRRAHPGAPEPPAPPAP